MDPPAGATALFIAALREINGEATLPWLSLILVDL
jgi:hypothetical protein